MFKNIALVTAALIAVGCNTPVPVPASKEEPGWIEREAELQERIKKGETILVFRTTAQTIRIDQYQGGNHKAERYRGPMSFITFDNPSALRGATFVVTAEYRYLEELVWDGNKHTIEYWQWGKMLTTREATGPSVGSVSIKFPM
jgi:hypothetical protein